ncbi:unnamed protein product [Owenia fusiformis]|uniref:Uncharacterized protein n=1 Tax=Owenia fusiformis TaxID=6347 RepID=A0A8J1U897_OWEFU|nr:unnamed protein product [Owenia fusiformis]
MLRFLGQINLRIFGISAVRAFIQGKKNNGFFSQYKMKVQTVFKGSRNYRSLKRMKKRIFFTPSNPLHCGIHISSHKHYIISGIAEKNLPFSDSCMYISDWPESVEERRALGAVLQSYSKNCECRVDAILV